MRRGLRSKISYSQFSGSKHLEQVSTVTVVQVEEKVLVVSIQSDLSKLHKQSNRSQQVDSSHDCTCIIIYRYIILAYFVSDIRMNEVLLGYIVVCKTHHKSTNSRLLPCTYQCLAHDRENQPTEKQKCCTNS